MRTSHKTPRREVRWKLDKSANNRSLEYIVRRFEDYMDCVSASSAGSPLRRITASPHKWVSHRCPGYLREEITLTADVSRSVVIAHQYPSQSEICTICGQLVQHPSNPVPHHTTKRRRQPPPPRTNIPAPSIPPHMSHNTIYNHSHTLHPITPTDDSPASAGFHSISSYSHSKRDVLQSQYPYPEQTNWSSFRGGTSSTSHNGSLSSLLNPSGGYSRPAPTINTSYGSLFSSMPTSEDFLYGPGTGGLPFALPIYSDELSQNIFSNVDLQPSGSSSLQRDWLAADSSSSFSSPSAAPLANMIFSDHTNFTMPQLAKPVGLQSELLFASVSGAP